MELIRKAGFLSVKVKDILRESGFIHLIKRAFLFITSYKNFYIYENNLNIPNEIDLMPKMKNFSLNIITESHQLDDLITGEFDFSSSPNIVKYSPKRKIREASIENFDFRLQLGSGGVLFCGFVNKKLVHTNWLAMSEKANLDPFLLKIDWKNEATMGPSNTIPECRRLGIKTYVRSRMYQFLKEKGRLQAKGTFNVNNIAQYKSEAKLGSRIIGEGKQYKILGLRLVAIKPTKMVQQ